MDDDSMFSVSRGCFVFKKQNSKNNKIKSKGKKQLAINQLNTDQWYSTYIDIWTGFKAKLDDINKSIYSKFILDTTRYMTNNSIINTEYIPTACILTGVNLPDHNLLFSLLATSLKQSEPPVFVATLYSEHFSSVKNVVINMVSQLLNKNDQSDRSNETNTDSTTYLINQSDYSIYNLIDWYSNQLDGSRVAILIKDFEMCPKKELENFILLLSCFLKNIPIVMAIGIATTKANLHDGLSYNVVNTLSIKMLPSEPSVVFLNNIMDQVFLKQNCPFYLGGNVLHYIIDTFLYYNFSIKQCIESLKFCLFKHFYLKPVNCVFVTQETAQNALFDMLDEQTLEEITKLPSTNSKLKIDEHLKDNCIQLMIDLKSSIKDFHYGLRILHILVADLPNTPLGSQLRELYCSAMKSHIINNDSYQKCLRLLTMLSKDDLLEKINKICNMSKEFQDHNRAMSTLEFLESKIIIIKESSLQKPIVEEVKPMDLKPEENKVHGSRAEFKRKLVDNLKHEVKPLVSDFEMERSIILDQIHRIFQTILIPPTTMPLHELLIFDDLNSIRSNIVGMDRNALNTALLNPQQYLGCNCCGITSTDQLLSTMPDVCILYKLYLESTSDHINVYDWLQSFIAVISPSQNDHNDVDPEIQARFYFAMSELQYLGFIKSSKYKPDHVQSLTTKFSS